MLEPCLIDLEEPMEEISGEEAKQTLPAPLVTGVTYASKDTLKHAKLVACMARRGDLWVRRAENRRYITMRQSIEESKEQRKMCNTPTMAPNARKRSMRSLPPRVASV